MSEYVESDKEKAFRLMNTTLFRTAVKFRNNGDPEGNHWNTSAPPTQQNKSTSNHNFILLNLLIFQSSNHNAQPSANNTVRTVSSEPPTNSNYPSTSTSYVQPTNSYVQLSHQTVSSAPANYSGPNASNYSNYYMQPTSSNNYAYGPMPQTHMGVPPNGYPNGLVPPHYVISDPMNHQYRQPAPPPYGPVPYGMMVQYPQQNMFPNGMVAPNNTQTGSYYNVHHQPRPSHFPNQVGYNRGRGSYGSRPPRGVRKPWSSREQEFQQPVESYNLGLVKLNVYDAEDHTNQSRQMNAMVPGASQIADLEKQISAALDKAFAAYPDAPIETVAQLKERKDINGTLSSSSVAPEVQQFEMDTVARVATPALSEISFRALSTASPTVPTADKNPTICEDSSPSTSATVLSQENLPAATDNAPNKAKSSETEPELQETPILTSSSFRDAVLKNRAGSSKSIAPLRSGMPSKGTTGSNVNISTKRSNATKNARNADKVSKQAVAQKTGRTQTTHGQRNMSRKPPVPTPALAPKTTSTATESNASVSQIVKKTPPLPVFVIKNKFSQLSSAQGEEDKESADASAPDTTDEKKVVVAPKPPRKPKSDKKKEGKASGKAKKKQKQNKDSDAVAAEKKEDNNGAELEQKTPTVSFASEEEVFEFERSENVEEPEENEQSNNAEGNDEPAVEMMDQPGERNEEDTAEEPDTNLADAEEEELNELIRLAKKNSELNKAQEKDKNGVGEKKEKSKELESEEMKQGTEEAENGTATQLAIPEKSRSRFYVERVEEPVPPEPTTSAVDYANSAINRYQSCVGAPPGIRLASCGETDAETLAALRTLSIESISNPIAVMIGSDSWEKKVERQVKGRLMYFSKFVDHKLTEKVIPEWVGNIPLLDPKEKAHKRRERDQKVKGFLRRQADRTNEKYINYIGYTMMWFYRTLAKTYTTSMGPTFVTVALLESKGAEFSVEEWRLMKLILDNPNNENYGRIALNHPEFKSPESASFF
ncbi:hypothetical protein CAEBREN_10095 [Caenorhabditis brenneri]|uniref:Uncharacterized protein n=1 Tax=Caenorhabditis brenneri TaxID=135651 RepID=G0MBG6_CAEBE|nr:hypothetical protein CAEBREN_10095 [Caenorhabditis brenneri]